MDIQKFKENVVSFMCYPNGDDKFSALRVFMHGMASARLAKTINFAVKCMANDEYYVEIGTFSGFTLISAGYETNKPCIGIDDLSVEDFFAAENIEVARKNVRLILEQNLKMHSGFNIKFIESDFRKVAFEEDKKKKLAVLFIDGKHTEQEVNETLAWAEPYLAEDCVIIFDDSCMCGVDRAINDLWDRGGQLLFHASSNLDVPNEVTHYGVSIMYVKRKP